MVVNSEERAAFIDRLGWHQEITERYPLLALGSECSSSICLPSSVFIFFPPELRMTESMRGHRLRDADVLNQERNANV
jgi:hypothetical protein